MSSCSQKGREVAGFCPSVHFRWDTPCLPDPSYHFYLNLEPFAQFKPAYFLESDDVTEPGFQKAGVAKNICLLERKENH